MPDETPSPRPDAAEPEQSVEPAEASHAESSPAPELPEQTSTPRAGVAQEVTESLSARSEPEVLSEAAAVPLPQAALTLREKHPLATRWMHWLNFPFLALMIWSGLMIYWADSDPADIHPHQVYRIGLGSWTLFRFFPDWFYSKLGLTFSLAKGLSWHFFLMWLFGINGLLYVLYTFVSGAWRDLLPGRGALRDAWHVLLHDLHLRREMPSQGKYNAAQQIAYTLIVLSGAGSIVTGLAIYKPTQLHLLTTLLGGYEFARLLHFVLMLGYVIFFVIHVVQVALAGWNNFRGMVAGFELVKGVER